MLWFVKSVYSLGYLMTNNFPSLKDKFLGNKHNKLVESLKNSNKINLKHSNSKNISDLLREF
ncbi:hypothetical protein EHP00_1485 [Ecytonucleospora hepatopenaei]|uniref:Uncharacterized protein n=1 Tax=Ecytonucleospora hepatopenaei TaxID=646526 RepID=A0A1W0E8Z6_9MICR|nr:hypothetical protein EHP00_1485 [Ecytonucleospora hepatopenaei]